MATGNWKLSVSDERVRAVRDYIRGARTDLAKALRLKSPSKEARDLMYEADHALDEALTFITGK